MTQSPFLLLDIHIVSQQIRDGAKEYWGTDPKQTSIYCCEDHTPLETFKDGAPKMRRIWGKGTFDPGQDGFNSTASQALLKYVQTRLGFYKEVRHVYCIPVLDLVDKQDVRMVEACCILYVDGTQ